MRGGPRRWRTAVTRKSDYTALTGRVAPRTVRKSPSRSTPVARRNGSTGLPGRPSKFTEGAPRSWCIDNGPVPPMHGVVPAPGSTSSGRAWAELRVTISERILSPRVRDRHRTAASMQLLGRRAGMLALVARTSTVSARRQNLSSDPGSTHAAVDRCLAARPAPAIAHGALGRFRFGRIPAAPTAAG